MPTSTSCTTDACRADVATKAIDADELAALFKALGHPARVQLLLHLARHKTCFFGDLSEVVGLAPSTTSQHMKILREAGLVLGSPQEQRTCYCVNPARMAVLKGLVENL